MLKPALAAVFFLFPTFVQAQENNRAILVLDGSGSMWGQIDGKAKITIAQEVIGDLLSNLPAEQELGLTVYGHRTKGSCTDIETIIQPGPGQRDAIARAVNAIKPKGKTPMTDAVIAAANSLRYTEEKATVILVSDGIETCNPDPCAAARALEEAGVDFTAHVVGFNISDPEAIAQMQCLAKETGGTFLTAENADELAAALITVAATPEPEPVPVEVTFKATLEINGPQIDAGLVWAFADDAAETSAPGGPISRNMLPGTYQVTVIRLEDENSVDAEFTVTDQSQSVVLVLPKIVYQAELTAVDQAPVGATIDVDWSAGDVNENDYITVADPGEKPANYQAYAYVKGASPQAVRLPLIPGEYELRYVRNAPGQPDEVIATRMIILTDIAATIVAPDDVPAGSEIDVAWDGPNYQGDYLTIAITGEDAHKYETYSYVQHNNPTKITAPLLPGEYELRYVANGNPDRVLGTKAITVTQNSATLSAPDQAIAGVELQVDWEGPDNKNDYISVAALDDSAHKYVQYTYTRTGASLVVIMPLEPGIYELRYVANGNPDEILTSKQIEIIAAEVTLDAPDQAIAGSEINVNWSGPDNKNDYISVAELGASSHKYANYSYTRRGQPAIVKMPLEPGTFELRYVANGNPDIVLTSRTIEIIAAEVVLEAPKQGVVGTTISVSYVGPDNRNDYISLAEIGSDPGKYNNYTYTARGNPISLKLPENPGTYLIRYVANGTPDRVLSRRSIKVVEASAEPAVTAQLEANDTVTSGGTLEVFWVGPDEQGDRIVISAIGSTEPLAEIETANGNPAVLPLPNQTGKYMLHYISGNSGNSIGTRPLTLK